MINTLTEVEKLLIEDIISGKTELYKHDDLFDKLFEFYSDEMPYGVAKARTGDPYIWITKKLKGVQEEPAVKSTSTELRGYVGDVNLEFEKFVSVPIFDLVNSGKYDEAIEFLSDLSKDDRIEVLVYLLDNLYDYRENIEEDKKVNKHFFLFMKVAKAQFLKEIEFINELNSKDNNLHAYLENIKSNRKNK